MQPTQETQLDLLFGVSISPWWLLLLLPLAAAAGWALYRAQFRDVSRRSSAVLLGVRIALLAGVVFLAFRPSLIYRRVLTYPGRVMLVVDDTMSMAARDTAMSDAEALRVSRGLGNRTDDQAETYYRLAAILTDIQARLRTFQDFARGADRESDRFWDRAGEAQDAILGEYEEFMRLGETAPALGEESARRFAAVGAEAARLRDQLSTFFAGERSPGRSAYDQYARRLQELADVLTALQGILDERSIAAGDAALTAAAEAVRGRTRLDLLAEKVSESRDTFDTMLGNQGVQFVRLSDGEVFAADAFAPADVEPADAVTDIVGRLNDLSAAESDFPLSGVVLLSDGRDLAGGSLDALAQAMSRKQSPAYAAAVGSVSEPVDLAVLRTIAPPFAVQGSPVNVRVRVKTALPKPVPVKLDVLHAEEVVASETYELGAADEQVVNIAFTPEALGLFRYTLRFEPTGGESFPIRNNTADFAVNVREDKVRVLMLDYKPRWETRFALNIFRRMDYVDLNAIIVLTQPDQTLTRGVQEGAWPASPAALQMYDLIVLGDIPADLLSADEWDALATAVLDQGKTLCLLAPGESPVPQRHADALLPVAPTGDATTAPAREIAGDPDALRLSPAGRVHPITRAMGGEPGLDVVDEAGAGSLRPDTQLLLSEVRSGRSLLTGRLAGTGKTLLIGADRLWKRLNPTMLDAHGQAFVSMVTWAIEGGFTSEDADGPRLALDLRTLRTDGTAASSEVWVYDPPADAVIEAIVNDETAAQAPAEPPRVDAAMARAEFDALPAGEVRFALGGAEQIVSEPILVIRDDPELKRLAQDAEFLTDLAASTGGAYRPFYELERLFMQFEPKQRVEKIESVWRMWDAATILALLLGLLTVEWIYRKLVGLV